MKNKLQVLGVAILLACVLVSGMLTVGRTAISELVGLSVATSATAWNSVIDAAKGDSQTSGVLGQSPYLWNGLSFDRVRGDITNGMDVDVTRISGAVTPSDAYANPTTANQMWSLLGGWNGATWDRLRTASADTLAITGILAAGNLGWNGTSYDRLRTVSGDALPVTGILAAGQTGFNGSTNDRVRLASATNNTATTSLGAQYVTPMSTWSITHTPAVATQATISKAAGGGTVRHVATSVTWCVAANTTAQTPLLIHLRDGATGAGTIIRTWAVSALVGTSSCDSISGLNMTGTANTAMTIETAAAPVAAAQATVSMTGYSTP